MSYPCITGGQNYSLDLRGLCVFVLEGCTVPWQRLGAGKTAKGRKEARSGRLAGKEGKGW